MPFSLVNTIPPARYDTNLWATVMTDTPPPADLKINPSISPNFHFNIAPSSNCRTFLFPVEGS